MSVLLLLRPRARKTVPPPLAHGLYFVDHNGDPVAVSLVPLRGEWGDGSLRSVGVQFDATLTNGESNALSYAVQVVGHGETLTVPLDVWRWDGSSGSVRVSAGFPLKPGQLFSADLTGFDTGWLEPDWDGAHRVQQRAVFFPFDSQYLCDTYVALVPLQPESDDTTAASPVREFFQTDSGANRTLGEWALGIRTAEYGKADGASTYEHVHGFFCAALRADSASKRRVLYQQAYDTLLNQCCGDAVDQTRRIGTNFNTSDSNAWTKVYGGADPTLPASSVASRDGQGNEPKSGTAMGMGMGYLLTAWKQPWRHVAYLKDARGFGGNTYSSAKNIYVRADGGPRVNFQWGAMNMLVAHLIGATMQVKGAYGSGRNNDIAVWENDFEYFLDALAEYELTGVSDEYDGLPGCRATYTGDGASHGGGFFPTYMLTIAARYLILRDIHYPRDARVVTWLRRMAARVKTQIVINGTRTAIPYFMQNTPATETDLRNTEDWLYGPFFSQLLAWDYAYSRDIGDEDISSKDACERCSTAAALVDINGNPQVGGTKVFGEVHSGHHQSTPFYLTAQTTEPPSGVRATSVRALPTYTS